MLAALLFGTLEQAGLAINAHVPKRRWTSSKRCAIVLVAVANRSAKRTVSERPLRRAASASPRPKRRRELGRLAHHARRDAAHRRALRVRRGRRHLGRASGRHPDRPRGRAPHERLHLGRRRPRHGERRARPRRGRRSPGAALSLLHAVLVERARVHAVISGIALNLLAYAGTRLALRGLFDSASNSPAIHGFSRLRALGIGALLARCFTDPVTIAAALRHPLTPFVLAPTRFGLRIGAAGENPVAAASVGIDVTRVRVLALAVSGAVCALGGVHLAFDQHRFESGMSNGRGFMALAAVVVSGWRAGRALLACLAFGALEALQIVLQDQTRRSSLEISSSSCRSWRRW